MDSSNFAAELCHAVSIPGFLSPNPIPRPFDTDADSDPDPELPSPLTFSDDLKFGPETYTYTAKRYTFTHHDDAASTSTSRSTKYVYEGLPIGKIIV